MASANYRRRAMSWFEPKLCNCETFHYAKDYNWEKEFQEMKYPPVCAKCGKWMDRVQTCVRCGHDYYQFFFHPLMGWEPMLPLRGWECWNCLEEFCRDITGKPLSGPKKPPPSVILPPGYMLYKQVNYFAGI